MVKITWNGGNLKEVISVIGLHPSVNDMSWEEYESLVKREGLKIITDQGHTKVNIGETICCY